MQTTSAVNIENLVNSGRPLTWIEPPICRSCSLPFSSNGADAPVKRLPFLLNCQHVLCEPCVLESRTRKGVVCQQCQTETPLLGDENSALSLQPSLYLLGAIQQGQYELLNLDQDSVPGKPDRKRSESLAPTIRKLPSSELDTVEQVRKLLELAYHSCERNRKKLETYGRQQEENVSTVIEQVSGCFLKRHHLLQLAEQQMMSKIRGRYVELRHQHDEAQSQLQQAHERLQGYLKLVKKYKKNQTTDSQSKESWLTFSAEVKEFLETAPLKLLDDVKELGRPFFCNTVEESLFLRSIPTYGTMVAENKECAGIKLLPYTARAKQKEKPKDKGHKRSSERSSSHSHQPEKEKSSSVVASDRKDHKRRSPDRTSSHREKEKTPPLKEQRERHHCGSSSKYKQKRKDKSPSKSMSETSSVAALPSSSSRLSPQISLKANCIPHDKVVVTNVNSPHEIFVQRELFAQHSQMMAEMCSLDAEQYASECLEKPLEIVEGAMYLVQPVVPSSFSWPSKWYRARVLRAYPPQQYLVLYVDFGHQEQVPASKICRISKDLRAFDFCVQKVQLYGLAMVQPERAGGQSAKLAECCQVLIDLIAHRTLLMATLSANSKSSACVDLLVPEGCSTRQPPQSLRGALLYLGFCKPHQTTDTPASVSKSHEKWLQARYKAYAKMLPAPKIAEVDTFPCTILQSTSPDSFQLIPSLWLKTKLEPLQQLLDVYGPNAPKVYNPFVGLICCFWNDEAECSVHWMRCRIERVGLAECDLKAIDSGRQYVCVPWYNIRLLDPDADCYWMHPLALECRLAHITPKVATITASNGDEALLWSKEAIAEFNTVVGSQACDFEVTIERCESDHSYSVLLYLLNRSTKDTCINGTLVQNGHAISCGPANALADRTKKVVEVIDPVPDQVPSAQPSSKAGKERLKDPRIRVEVLSPISSPSEFYIRLHSCLKGLEELHHTIQQYMEQMLEEENEQPEEERAIGMLCVAFTPTSPGSDSEWYRACITGVTEPFYQMLLIDTAQSVRVHRTNIARLPARFTQIQPGAIRCRLANVVPIGGQEQWHQTSIDGFKNAIATSSKHAISLDVASLKKSDSELPVVLWALIEDEVAPLAPRRDRYININQSLITYGLARCISRPGTAASPGKGEAAENPERMLEEAISAQFRARFEQMQQFFRTVDDVTGNQTASAPVRMGGIVGSATDSACDELLSLIDQQPMPISDWLPPGAPIEKTVFVGRPTFVADDGALYLHDECQEPLLTRMAERIRLHVETARQQQGKRKMRLLNGDPCLARFHLDGQWYRGKVLEVKKDCYSVQFVDYGNVEQCTAADLWDETICTRIPVQAYRLRLAYIEPADIHGWARPAVETFHSLIVGKRCMVRIVDQNGAEPLCTLQTIGDENCIGVYVDQALLAMDALFVHRTSRKSNLSDPPCQQTLMVQEIPSPYNSNHAARDIIALMNEVQEQFGRSPGAASDGQADDPYAWNDGVEDDTSGDVANRAQIFNLFSPSPDRHSSASSSDAGCVAVEDTLLSTPLPSPATFVSNELETSSRLSSVERVLGHNDGNDEIIDTDVECTRGGAMPFRGFRMLELTPSQTGFYASCTNYNDPLTLHIYPHLEGHRKRCDQMAKSIQEYARSTNKMRRWQATMLEPGAPCLAVYAEDGLHYRAIIEGWDEVERTARVLYVDYLNRAAVSIDRDLCKCPIALRNLPVHNLLVRLAGVQPNPKQRPDDVSRQLVTHLQRTFFVRVVGKVNKRNQDDVEPEECFEELAEPANEIPLVELYTDADCSTLIYQKLIDERVYIKPSFSMSRKR
ncbi:RING finger protein 17-like [Anopheles albimanus]|uniref:Tudor domain-containing protein n=1 Tax=Anopheles albimanus TaxID=7167 RepID=A0A182FTT6_ANOAL|nr:RING finger protein 17-like [Anopheles albimanus]